MQVIEVVPQPQTRLSELYIWCGNLDRYAIYSSVKTALLVIGQPELFGYVISNIPGNLRISVIYKEIEFITNQKIRKNL